MENLIKRLRIIGLYLFAIALGIYLLNIIGIRFLYVASPLYYALLMIAGLLYIVGIIGIYKGYRYVKTRVRYVGS